ncbi:MAG: sulfite exporter TauE/SafE family protein [Burkholderiales bacterium]|nr:sulfite exporter TauE/SafE family protein [Burkholderiales bacterium]
MAGAPLTVTRHPSRITHDMDWWWAYLAVGVFVGFFSGLLGIGGGSALVPVLAFIYAAKGFPAPYVVHLALGTGIAAICLTATASAWSHHRHNAVNWRLFARFLPGVTLGTLAGVLLASHLDARLISIVFTALIFYVAALMLIERRPRPKRELPGATAMSVMGGIVGLFSSLTATGGATMIVAYLVRRDVPVHEAIGTASAASWSLALAGTAGYIAAGARVPELPAASLGFVHLPALAWIVAASMLLAPVGASVAHRTPGKALKRIFAVVLLALATGMLAGFF